MPIEPRHQDLWERITAHRVDDPAARLTFTARLADIWPPADRRFGDDLAWRRVNVARNWVIPKPAWLAARPRHRAAGIAALGVVPLLAVGIPNPLNLTAEPFLAIYAALATAAMVAGIVLRQVLVPEGNPDAATGDVEPLEVALLADDGRFRFAAAGLALLADAPAPADGASSGDAAAPLVLSRAPPPDGSRLLADLHARLAALGVPTTLEAVKAAIDTAREEVEPRLVDRGLLVGPWWSTTRPWIILAPLLATLGLGIAKIVVGISRGKPVGFLVIGSFVLAVLGFLLLARNPRRTRQGDAVVRAAWARFRSSGGQDTWRVNKADGLLPLAVALLGTATLGGTAHAFIDQALNTLRPGSSGGGCGTGGGDGGGGCGGCGGCGGGD